MITNPNKISIFDLERSVGDKEGKKTRSYFQDFGSNLPDLID